LFSQGRIDTVSFSVYKKNILSLTAKAECS